MNDEAVYRTAPATPGLLMNDEAVNRTAPATPGLLKRFTKNYRFNGPCIARAVFKNSFR